jgi:signal peptide peptidase SppA
MIRSQLLAIFAELTGEQIFAIDEQRIAQASAPATSVDAPKVIALIPVRGVLSPRGYSSYAGRLEGMEGLRDRINSAARNPDVSAIVLDVDSPGGTVAGTPETAQTVAAAAKAKPVIAVANTLAASAAYWIASQATQLVVTPSADVGSVGVISAHLDMSKMLEDFGLKVTMVSAGKYKAEGSPFAPLADEAKANMQARVDEAYADFIRDVAAGRKVTQARAREEFGQGRVVSARRAVDIGMADRVATLPEVIGGLLTPKGQQRRRSSLAFA